MSFGMAAGISSTSDNLEIPVSPRSSSSDPPAIRLMSLPSRSTDESPEPMSKDELIDISQHEMVGVSQDHLAGDETETIDVSADQHNMSIDMILGIDQYCWED